MRGKHQKKPKKDNVWIRFLKFAKTPKGCITGALVLLTLEAGVTPSGRHGIAHAAEAVVAAVVFDWLVARVLRRKAAFSTGGVITGLIVADVLSGLTPGYVVVLTTIIALLSKHLLNRGRKPIFNPAAVGLLVSLGVFSSAQSWWGSMPLMSWWHFLLFLAVGVFVATRVRKYMQVLVFLGTYVALLLVMAVYHFGLPSATPADALRTPFINAALFLGFFMLTDPPSTPATLRGQIQFSVIVATVSVFIFSQLGGLAYLLAGLLAGNLWTVWLARAPKPGRATRNARGSKAKDTKRPFAVVSVPSQRNG